VGVVIPGTDRVGVGPQGGAFMSGATELPTITIQRDDGSVRRIRRCD